MYFIELDQENIPPMNSLDDSMDPISLPGSLPESPKAEKPPLSSKPISQEPSSNVKRSINNNAKLGGDRSETEDEKSRKSKDWESAIAQGC